ncbi:unnamed protein product [Prunus armeniaca]|uniref:Uncharacterized protein n=1 Tax=Prunus armeniaca TaxID=36596 RepID=A0A6J5X226_PRUAR|nr:unnamed protein product [Prunus armeniaca]
MVSFITVKRKMSSIGLRVSGTWHQKPLPRWMKLQWRWKDEKVKALTRYSRKMWNDIKKKRMHTYKLGLNEVSDLKMKDYMFILDYKPMSSST